MKIISVLFVVHIIVHVFSFAVIVKLIKKCYEKIKVHKR